MKNKVTKYRFFFITYRTSVFDPNFDFQSEKMISLIKEINRRGHNLGIHPGYECYKNEKNFITSVEKLKQSFIDNDIDQNEIGGRMHCLRYDIAKTPSFFENAGLSYDSSLGFAEKPGFRCGTCREFSMFDLHRRRPLSLKQRPLINMECSIIEEKYEGLGCSEAAEKRFLSFKNLVKKYNGKYTLLWHNSNFDTSQSKAMYQRIIN